MLLRTPAIAAAVLAFAVTFLGNSLFVIYLPTWLEDALGATPAQVGALFFTGGIANVISGPRAGRLSVAVPDPDRLILWRLLPEPDALSPLSAVS